MPPADFSVPDPGEPPVPPGGDVPIDRVGGLGEQALGLIDEPSVATAAGAAPAELGFVYWPHFGDYEGLQAVLGDLRELDAVLPAKVVRLGVSWADWTRPEVGPAWLDHLITSFHSAGVEIVPTLMWTPPSLGMNPYSHSPPKDFGTFVWFTDHFLELYGNRISDYVQIWSEPTGYCYWDRSADPCFEIFAKMYIYSASLIRQRYGKRVVLAGVDFFAGAQWIEIMGGYGALAYTDVIALHGFPGTWYRRRAGWDHVLNQMRAAARRFGFTPEIWIAEASFSTGRLKDRRSAWAEYQQVRMMRGLLRRPVSRVFWYSFRDLPQSRPAATSLHMNINDPLDHGCGLKYVDGTPKLLWRVLSQIGPEAIRRDDVPTAVLRGGGV